MRANEHGARHTHAGWSLLGSGAATAVGKQGTVQQRTCSTECCAAATCFGLGLAACSSGWGMASPTSCLLAGSSPPSSLASSSLAASGCSPANKSTHDKTEDELSGPEVEHRQSTSFPTTALRRRRAARAQQQLHTCSGDDACRRGGSGCRGLLRLLHRLARGFPDASRDFGEVIGGNDAALLVKLLLTGHPDRIKIPARHTGADRGVGVIIVARV